MLALVRNIEKSQGYRKLWNYMDEKYKGPSNKVKFRTYEDDGGQDLQSSTGNKKIQPRYCGFEEFLDEIYNEVGN